MEDPALVNNYALLEYFGLQLAPMLHCFSIGHQNTIKYGGFPLTNKSQPKDISENILGYLESISCENDDEQMLFTRRVLIEKINVQHINLTKLKRRKK